MDRISGLWGLLPCQSHYGKKLFEKFFSRIVIVNCNQVMLNTNTLVISLGQTFLLKKNVMPRNINSMIIRFQSKSHHYFFLIRLSIIDSFHFFSHEYLSPLPLLCLLTVASNQVMAKPDLFKNCTGKKNL